MKKRELDHLKDAYAFDKSANDVPLHAIIDDIPNHGEAWQFIESIKKDDPAVQSCFLAQLVKVRKECKERLIELTKTTNEDAVIWAAAGLLYTDSSDIGLEILKEKCLERINTIELENGQWPLHFLLGELAEAPAPAGDLLLEILKTAKSELDPKSESFSSVQFLSKKYGL